MRMKTVFYPALGVLALLLLSGCTQTGQVTQTTGDSQERPATLSATVNIAPNGYEPQTVTIKKGGSVTWLNTTDTENWPASAVHPTHEKYPGSGITKCGTPEESKIFDACKGLARGESYSFEFNETGEWAYHDHVGVKTFGKVIVVE